MKELYSIGEISNIFNVTIDTLRYYDKLNLIKPILKADNGYRYYSKTQFEMISTVLLLKSSGTPLSTLNDVLHQDESKRMINELHNQRESLKVKIEKLQQLEKRIDIHLEHIKEVSNTDEITVKRCPDFYILKQDFKDDDDLDIKEIMNANRSTDSVWILHANIFSTISVENIQNHQFHTYKSYGYISEISPDSSSKSMHVLKSQLYACMNVKSTLSDLSDLDEKYIRLINYIELNNFRVIGDVIERSILDLNGKNGNQNIHYFKIYIPIEEKNGV
jgi:DNA-binding transcriptional MerR regulator